MQHQALRQIFRKILTFTLGVAILTASAVQGAGAQERIDYAALAKQFILRLFTPAPNKQQELHTRDLSVGAAIATDRQLQVDVPFAQIDLAVKSARNHAQNFQKAQENHQPTQAQAEYLKARFDYANAYGMAMPPALAQARCIWLDRETIVNTQNEQGMDALIDKLQQDGINVVYFETNNAGYAMFNSQLEPKNPLISKSYDPLQAAVQAAHKRHMELMVWAWMFAVGSKGHNRLPGVDKDENYVGPVIEANPNLALRSDSGSPNPPGQNEFWISPANPQARAFVIKLLAEIVTKYPVNGVQYDYVRFPWQLKGNEMGFDQKSREVFKDDTGITLPRSTSQLDDKTRQIWQDWKTGKVTQFVREATTALRSLRPSLFISAAVYATPLRARLAAIQQNWEVWADEGLVDILNPMTYSPDVESFADSAAFVRQSVGDKCLVYPGTSIDRYPAPLLIDHFDAAHKLGFLGTTIFAVAHLKDSKEQILKDGPNRKPVSVVPHKEPITAAQLLFNDFALHANDCADGKCYGVLATAGESNNILAKTREIQRDLNLLTEPAKQADLEAVLAKLTDLQKSAGSWLHPEALLQRSGRADYLLGELDNVHWLLTYSVQKAKRYQQNLPPTLADAQGHRN